MKCIVEVISDTLSKPNPLPISEECLETLRGGTGSDLMLGISKSRSGTRQGVPHIHLPHCHATGCTRPQKWGQSCCSAQAMHHAGIVAGECWLTWSCLVFMGPSCHLNHMVKRCGSKSYHVRENSKRRGNWYFGFFLISWGWWEVAFDPLLYQVSLLQMNESFLSFATKIYWRNFRKLLLKVQCHYSYLGRGASSVIIPCTVFLFGFFSYLTLIWHDSNMS